MNRCFLQPLAITCGWKVIINKFYESNSIFQVDHEKYNIENIEVLRITYISELKEIKLYLIAGEDFEKRYKLSFTNIDFEKKQETTLFFESKNHLEIVGKINSILSYDKKSLLKIQPLAIPKGWYIQHNIFYDVSPSNDLPISSPPENKNIASWDLFDTNLLTLEHKEKELWLNFGWNPSYSPEGSYNLILLKSPDFDWDNPIAEFDTHSKEAATKKINQILLDIDLGLLNF